MVSAALVPLSLSLVARPPRFVPGSPFIACSALSIYASMADGVGKDSTMGDTFFQTFESELEEDLTNDDLRRMFDIHKDQDVTEDERQELMLMYKLKQELGDEDYARIFDDPKVRGANLWDLS